MKAIAITQGKGPPMKESGFCESNDAEVGVFDPKGNLVDVWNRGNTVKGYVSLEEVMRTIVRISKK